MGDCNFGLPYNNPPDCHEICCKYACCVTCRRASSRRRTRSETSDTGKKRCKELRTLTPKKYNHKCMEYENMELEYDFKGWNDTKYDCCRIRPNLVELPTSYISNNCQLPPNIVPLSKSNGDYFKSLKIYEHPNTCNSCAVELANFEHFNMVSNEPRNSGSRTAPTNHQTKIDFHSRSSFHMQKTRGIFNENHSEDGGHQQNTLNCREYCQLVDLKGHDTTNRGPLCYDTNTYFNRLVDKEKYVLEVDYLKDTLKVLHSAAYSHNHHVPLSIVNLDNFGNGDNLRDTLITTTIEVKPKPVKKNTPAPLLKTAKSRISLKTKKAGRVKVVKSKASHSSVANTACDDDSCSDSDSVEDEDPESISGSDPVSTDESSKDLAESGPLLIINLPDSGETASWPVRSSLFPNIPPYIKFQAHDLDRPYKLPCGRKFFKWKLSTITPIIVKKTLTNSGLALVRKSNQWLGTWGRHMKSPMFKTLKETQKLNHFPGTFQLGRKDRLWRNFQRMIAKYGLKEFGFLPQTYILPQELKLLKQSWDFKQSGGKEMWIIKPPASARGVGIKVVNKLHLIPKKTLLVCQKYIGNPYLINGSKFDLRLYVLVTSFHPLRIYLYPDGLARFASSKYSDDLKDIKDRYIHLTNYSINKLSSQYTANEDANSCQGHKWTLSKLMEYLHDEGVDTKTLWKNLQQLVIKTMISSEALITPLCEENMNNNYNCYELFGIDVLLDEHLKPWLLEVNISPSLHSASPLDAHVKGPLVQTLFDIAQFHLHPGLMQNVKNSPQGFDARLYTRTLTKKERSKHATFGRLEGRDDYLVDILHELTGDDVRQLLRAEDEYVVKGKFERIFPTAHTYKYLDFMESRYYNRLFDAWESKYANKREDGIALLQTLCAQKVHLKTGSLTTFSKNSPSTNFGQPTVTNLLQSSTVGQTRPLEEIMQDASITPNTLILPAIVSEEIRV